MKVLDLHCPSRHQFEGWFASEDEFQRQLKAGFVECPMCGATEVTKLISAPRLNLGAQPVAGETPPASQDAAQSVADLMRTVRRLVATTEDVGDRFPEEARRMHYGESPERGIRGQATQEQTRELMEEGIPVLPLPWPKALKEPLH